MSISQDIGKLERLDSGIILQQLDDLCFVRLGDRLVDAAQTRELGERLIAFIEKAGCRKLVMSFDGIDSIYGFLLDKLPSAPERLQPRMKSSRTATLVGAGSDIWLG